MYNTNDKENKLNMNAKFIYTTKCIRKCKVIKEKTYKSLREQLNDYDNITTSVFSNDEMPKTYREQHTNAYKRALRKTTCSKQKYTNTWGFAVGEQKEIILQRNNII